MTKQITVTLSESAFKDLESFVDSAINDKEEYLDNWAKGDGYTEEDFKTSRKSIEEVRELMARLTKALEDAPEGKPATVDPDIGTDSHAPYAPEMIPQGWVIFSANEASTMDGAGFWNTGHGWCLEEDANMHPAEWVGHYALPMSLGQDRHWINLPLTRKTTEAALCDALAVFCESQNLRHQSADDLLVLEDLKAFQIRWLEQFIRQWEAAMGQ